MDYQRSERVGELLSEVIADVLREDIRDPRVTAVTITAARVTKDLRQARIYFTILIARSAHDNFGATRHLRE